MSAPDFILWAVQFSLDLVGLHFAAKKAIKPLALYLASRATFDILTCAALLGSPFYSYAFWICKPLEYAFLGVLAVSLVGELLQDSKPMLQSTVCIVSLAGTAAIISFYSPITATRMLHIEQGVNYVLALFVVGGMVAAKTENLTAWGLVTLCGIDGTLDFLTNGQSRWYALEIVPLCLWAWQAHRFNPNVQPFAVVPLGVRVEGCAEKTMEPTK